MKITVFVSPKPTVVDPQGAAVGHAMAHLGITATEVRVGKTITFTVDAEPTDQTREQIDGLCKDLLSNPVIEDYRFEIS